ncbi:MAG: hypothetical protein J0H68_02955 [Sphingobacteriia bacterium]|nr:hypothetical protein [Sphingobacteriia bacterium]
MLNYIYYLWHSITHCHLALTGTANYYNCRVEIVTIIIIIAFILSLVFYFKSEDISGKEAFKVFLGIIGVLFFCGFMWHVINLIMSA